MKRVMLVSIFILIGIYAYSQSNEFVDRLLETDSVNYGQAAYLVLVASDNLGEDADEARAFELLQNFGWAADSITAGQVIDLKGYSFLLMQAFGLPGGLMYTLFPSPRYAYRQLVSSLVIQGRSDPVKLVSGEQAIRMLGRIFDVKGIAQ
ncbi:hypothetical protein MASR2M29_09260 [Spirochaetota bacterium]